VKIKEANGKEEEEEESTNPATRKSYGKQNGLRL
jgi:hypothetical protein